MKQSFSRPLLARDRITKPFAKKEGWDDYTGWFEWIVNKETGQQWNVGRDYDFEGYVDVLNKDIADGKFK
jgi:hypothetical protein